MLTQVLHELLCDHNGNLVGLVVVIAEWDVFALLDLVVNGQTCLVADDTDLAVLHCGDRVGNDGDTGNTCGTCALNVTVMQSHLECLVVVLVVHVVDNLQCVHVGLCQPAHHLLEAGPELLVGEVVAGDWAEAGTYLLAANLVTAAVDGIQHTLGQVGASTEELHLLTDLHGANAACDAVVVAQFGTHQVVVLILQGASVDTYLCAVQFPRLGQTL